MSRDGYAGKILKVDLSSHNVSKLATADYAGRFPGGKGLATTLGVYAVLGIKPLILSLGVFLLVVGITRYVSLGSLLAVLSYPFFTYLFHGDKEKHSSNQMLITSSLSC